MDGEEFKQRGREMVDYIVQVNYYQIVFFKL